MKKIVSLVVSSVLILGLSACDPEQKTSDPAPKNDNGGGIGMTYDGKMGYDMGDGLILKYDGSGVGLGYGF